jgi:hypothetical protein
MTPHLCCSGQSSWLQIQGSGFDSLRYQIFWEVMGLERGPLSLVSITEEQLERKSGDFGLENREYGRRNPSRWPRGTVYPQKLEITSPTSGGRSVCIVRSRTQIKEFVLLVVLWAFVPSTSLTCLASLSSRTCYRLIRRGRHLTPPTKKPKHGQLTANCVLYLVYHISHIKSLSAVTGNTRYTETYDCSLVRVLLHKFKLSPWIIFIGETD